MTTKVFKGFNRTTNLSFENMALVVTKRPNGGSHLRLVQHGVRGAVPQVVTDFFLDAGETARLSDLIGG